MPKFDNIKSSIIKNKQKSLKTNSSHYNKQLQQKLVENNQNYQLYQKIKKIINVKSGIKGDYKFLSENFQTLYYGKSISNISFINANTQQLTTTSTQLINKSKCCSKMVKTKNKKIVKSPKKINNISEYLTSQDKSSGFTEQCQNIQQNSFFVNQMKFLNQQIHFYGYNRIKGSIGHSTLIFHHHITQGIYYIQFKIIPFYQIIGQSQYINKPQIRIGVCCINNHLDVPLGYQNSIGFHLSKKVIFAQGKIQQFSQVNQNFDKLSIHDGDVVGLLLQFSPPYKYPDSSKKWQDSSLSFTLNGQLIGRYTNLKQQFYHPAISLYNGATLQFYLKQQQMMYKPRNSIAYEKISKFINIYH